jgi:hypothetical protein
MYVVWPRIIAQPGEHEHDDRAERQVVGRAQV